MPPKPDIQLSSEAQMVVNVFDKIFGELQMKQGGMSSEQAKKFKADLIVPLAKAPESNLHEHEHQGQGHEAESFPMTNPGDPNRITIVSTKHRLLLAAKPREQRLPPSAGAAIRQLEIESTYWPEDQALKFDAHLTKLDADAQGIMFSGTSAENSVIRGAQDLLRHRDTLRDMTATSKTTIQLRSIWYQEGVRDRNNPRKFGKGQVKIDQFGGLRFFLGYNGDVNIHILGKGEQSPVIAELAYKANAPEAAALHNFIGALNARA